MRSACISDPVSQRILFRYSSISLLIDALICPFSPMSQSYFPGKRFKSTHSPRFPAASFALCTISLGILIASFHSANTSPRVFTFPRSCDRNESSFISSRSYSFIFVCLSPVTVFSSRCPKSRYQLTTSSCHPFHAPFLSMYPDSTVTLSHSTHMILMSLFFPLS